MQMWQLQGCCDYNGSHHSLYDLIFETKCHEIMEHNTLVRRGFISSCIKPVPDAESERGQLSNLCKPIFQSSTSKRKSNVENKLPQSKNLWSAKKLLQLDISTNPSLKRKSQMDHAKSYKKKFNLPSSLYSSEKWQLIPQGCQWSSVNWSCGYDSVFMTFFTLYLQLHSHDQNTWTAQNNCTKKLSELYNSIDLHDNHLTSLLMNNARDDFRQYLFQLNSQRFPRLGPATTSVTDITDLMFQSLALTQKMIHCVSCNTCKTATQTQIELHIGYCATPSLWTNSDYQHNSFSTPQHWLNLFLMAGAHHAPLASKLSIESSLKNHHQQCSVVPKQELLYDFLLPSLIIEIDPTMIPSTYIIPEVYLQSVQGSEKYTLRSIIYSGQNHFTARLLDNMTIWNYDGAENNGSPQYYGALESISWPDSNLASFNGRHMHILLYGKQ
jgi:hypothetical protein